MIRWDGSDKPVDGPVSQSDAAICLTAGTMIDTPDGPRAIETLSVGDLVTTLDNGDQPIRMIKARKVAGDKLRADRKLWPVCIQAGALGFGLPERNLRVSQQQRMLYRHIRVPLLFGEDAVFVRAKSLAATLEEVYVESGLAEVTFYTLVFDRHEVIFAEGAPTESYQPGPESLAALDAETQDDLTAILPYLARGERAPTPDYMTLRSWELMAAIA